MIWQKAPLQSPLLVLNRSLHKDAVKVFKVIQRIMGDRERDRPVGVRAATENHLNPLTSSTSSLNASSTSLPSMVTGILEEERWLLTEGLAHGELRDEIYCQLVKQLTGNSNTYVQCFCHSFSSFINPLFQRKRLSGLAASLCSFGDFPSVQELRSVPPVFHPARNLAV